MKIPNFLMNDEVYIKPYKGHGAYGPIYDNSYDTKGRMELQRRVVTDKKGNEVVAKGTFFTKDRRIVEPESILTYEGIDYHVVSTEPQKGFSFSHNEVVIK